MSKYTKDYCSKNKVAVTIENEAQFKEMIIFTRDSPDRGYGYPGKGARINADNGCYSSAGSDYHQKNGYEIISFDQVNFTNMQKIIGYKTPFKINSLVHKGTLYVGSTSDGYCPKGREGTGSQWYLPAEIVEKWEIEYDQNIKIGDYIAEVARGGIKFGCQQFSKDELTLIYRIVKDTDLNGEVVIKGVKITVDIISRLIKMLN